MKKTLLCLGLLVVGVALLAPSIAQAAQRNEVLAGTYFQQAGGAKEIARRDPADDGVPPVGMPRTNTEVVDLPQAFGDDTTIARGSALVAPRGGSFVSSKQQADREIRALIRRLD